MMKKNLICALFLAATYCLLTSSGGGSTPAWQKENVSFPMMDLEINATMKEHDRQKEMRQKQTLNASVETANQSQWKNFGKSHQNPGQASYRVICHTGDSGRSSSEQGNHQDNE
jgi:hypothetical protein